VGCGFGLGVGNDDDVEAEAHAAGAVDKKDTGAREVATAAGGAGGIRKAHRFGHERSPLTQAPCRGRADEARSQRLQRESGTCVQVPVMAATWSASRDPPAPDADRLLTRAGPSSL
jgi:hypothetical protein